MLIAHSDGDDMHNIGVGIYDFMEQQAALELGVGSWLTSDLSIPSEPKEAALHKLHHLLRKFFTFQYHQVSIT